MKKALQRLTTPSLSATPLRRGGFLAMLLAMLLIITACDNKKTHTPEEKPTIKIGIITPLSSDVKQEATDLKNAAIYVAKQYDSSPVNFELIIEDDAGKPLRSISAAKKLISVDDVDVLITHLTGSAQVVSPVATEFNKLHIGTVTDGNIKGNPTSFRLFASANEMAKRYVKYLKDNKAKNIAVFVLQHATCEAIYNALEGQLKDNDIRFKKYSFVPGQKDFRMELLKVEKSNYDMVTFIMAPPEVDIIYKQYKEIGIKSPVSAIESISVADRKLFEGVFYVNAFPGKEEIIEEVRLSTNSKGSYAFAALIDALGIINKISVEYYKKNNKLPDTNEMVDMLLSMDPYDGVSGMLMVGEDRNINPPAVLMQIQNGEEVVVDE